MASPELCISLAARPGRYGRTVHTAGYRALGLDWLYRPCKVEHLEDAIRGVRALDIRGASIAMPFKEAVIPLLDELDDTAREVGAVNTVVNTNGRLKGYNTDVTAVEAALDRVNTQQGELVLVLGAGGVARAVRHALLRRQQEPVVVTTRGLERGEAFVAGTSFALLGWDKRTQLRADVIINCTPVGMAPDDLVCPLPREQIEDARAVIEIIATPSETQLARAARELTKKLSTGPEFSLDQACAQFTLYTGQTAPREAMLEALNSL